MTTLTTSIDEARENLRVIRQTMERSTKYSTLSGWSGVLIGLIAIGATVLSHHVLNTSVVGFTLDLRPEEIVGIWFAAATLAIATEFICNKRRAAGVGKHLVSRLGAHIILAALPGFLTLGVLTLFLITHGLMLYAWGVWMLCYGVSICAVGLFSVKPVSYLGAAFVIAGAVTLFLPAHLDLWMMCVSFGGFHIVYGILMGRRYGW